MTRGNVPSKVPATPLTRNDEADIDRINSGISNLQTPTLNGGPTPPMSWVQQARIQILSGSRGPPNVNTISSSQIPAARDVLFKQMRWLKISKDGWLNRGFWKEKTLRPEWLSRTLTEGWLRWRQELWSTLYCAGLRSNGNIKHQWKIQWLVSLYIYTRLRYLIVIATYHHHYMAISI